MELQKKDGYLILAILLFAWILHEKDFGSQTVNVYPKVYSFMED